MELREWVEVALIGILGVVGAWFKGEHSRITKTINELEKDYSDVNTRLSIIEAQNKTQREHIDLQFEMLNKRLDQLFQKFDEYEKGRAEFLEKFEFVKRK